MNLKEAINSYKYNEALEIIDKMLSASPTNSKLLYTKSSVLYKLEKYEEAEPILIKLCNENPKSANLIYSLALVTLALDKKERAVYLLELAYERGIDDSIYKIIDLMFERKGICDYEACAVCCCKNVILKGIDGKTIKDEEAFTKFKERPGANTGWQKINENKKGDWIFSCENLGEKNICKIYETRPEECRDFPSGVLSLKAGCTYHFELKENIIKLQSERVFALIIEILEVYGYKKEVIKLKELHL